MNDDTHSTEGAVTQFVGRNSEVAVLDIDKAVAHIDKESVASPEHFVGFTRQKVSIYFGITRNPTDGAVLQCITRVGIGGLTRVFNGFNAPGRRLSKLFDILAENPFS